MAYTNDRIACGTDKNMFDAMVAEGERNAEQAAFGDACVFARFCIVVVFVCFFILLLLIMLLVLLLFLSILSRRHKPDSKP